MNRCYLASAVMLGGASEAAFLDLGRSFAGGFSFVLWEYQDKETGAWRENRYRPRLCIAFASPDRSNGR